MTFLEKRSLFVKALFVTAIFVLSLLLASCASEATQLNVEAQAIEVQADGTDSEDRADKKTHTKDSDGKGHNRHGYNRGQPFELVATAIGIDMDKLKAELGAGKSIATIAQENGVAAQTVIDELVAGSQTRMDAAIAAGKLTAEDAAAWQAKLTERFTYFVNNTQEAFSKAKEGRSKGAHGNHSRSGKGGDKFATIAELIGMDTKALFTELKAGKSIAQVATDKGVNPQTIVDSLMQDMTTRLDEAVAAGKITAEEAQQKRVGMQEDITAWINGTKGKN